MYGSYHHRNYFDLCWVSRKPSGQSFLRDGIAVQLVELVRRGAQKSKGHDDGEEEDDTQLRLTAEEAWLFPVVGSPPFFCAVI